MVLEAKVGADLACLRAVVLVVDIAEALVGRARGDLECDGVCLAAEAGRRVMPRAIGLERAGLVLRYIVLRPLLEPGLAPPAVGLVETFVAWHALAHQDVGRSFVISNSGLVGSKIARGAITHESALESPIAVALKPPCEAPSIGGVPVDWALGAGALRYCVCV